MGTLRDQKGGIHVVCSARRLEDLLSILLRKALIDALDQPVEGQVPLRMPGGRRGDRLGGCMPGAFCPGGGSCHCSAYELHIGSPTEQFGIDHLRDGIARLLRLHYIQRHRVLFKVGLPTGAQCP